MTLYEYVVLAGSGAVLAGGVWALVRRWSPRRGGPFPDVPDASPAARPIDAPGITGPYSSLDPFAPPKRPVSWSETDEAPPADSTAERVP